MCNKIYSLFGDLNTYNSIVYKMCGFAEYTFSSETTTVNNKNTIACTNDMARVNMHLRLDKIMDKL